MNANLELLTDPIPAVHMDSVGAPSTGADTPPLPATLTGIVQRLHACVECVRRAAAEFDPDEPSRAAEALVAAGAAMLEYEQLVQAHDWLLLPSAAELPGHSPAHRLAATCRGGRSLLAYARAASGAVLAQIAEWPMCGELEPELGLRALAGLVTERDSVLNRDERLELRATLRAFARELADFEARPYRRVPCEVTTIRTGALPL